MGLLRAARAGTARAGDPALGTGFDRPAAERAVPPESGVHRGAGVAGVPVPAEPGGRAGELRQRALDQQAYVRPAVARLRGLRAPVGDLPAQQHQRRDPTAGLRITGPRFGTLSPPGAHPAQGLAAGCACPHGAGPQLRPP
ncbi:hypothetical protein FNH05_34635, partial [Amycolatopsis rhizosphaerae]